MPPQRLAGSAEQSATQARSSRPPVPAPRQERDGGLKQEDKEEDNSKKREPENSPEQKPKKLKKLKHKGSPDVVEVKQLEEAQA